MDFLTMESGYVVTYEFCVKKHVDMLDIFFQT